MGLLALSLMLVIFPCLISVDAGPNSIQRLTGLDRFKPPREGCVVNLIVESSETCEWCDGVANALTGMLAANYVQMTEMTLQPYGKNYAAAWNMDYKGTCFINWLIVGDYKGLDKIFNPKQLSAIRTKDWFVYIQEEEKNQFLKCWADIIDAHYGKVVPRVALVMVHGKPGPSVEYYNNAVTLRKDHVNEDTVCSIAVSCYMCPESQSYFKWAENTLPVSPWDLVKNAGEEDGYNDVTALATLETDYFNHKTDMYGFQFENVLKFAAGRHLNYNFAKPNTSKIKIPGLVIEAVWSQEENEKVIQDLENTPYKTVFLTKEAYNLVYCRALESNKYVTVLVSPFNTTIWALLLLSFVSICIIPGVRFGMSLTLVRQFLGQPPQGKQIATIVAFVTVVLIPIQYLYKEFFSTNAMTPFDQKPYLDTNQKLFDSGFKLICYNDDHCRDQYEYLTSKNLNLTKNASEYVIRPEEFGMAPRANWLALSKDRGTFYRRKEFKDVVLKTDESHVLGIKCYMVADYWEVWTLSFQFTGPLTQAFYDTLRTFRQAGIVGFWEKTSLEMEKRQRIEQLLKASSENDNTDYESGVAYMIKALISMVHLFAGMSVLIILCLVAEILYPQIRARWTRYMERRRFLRAIWPLGRI